eukprot:4977901-Amphidinium_carterae.1
MQTHIEASPLLTPKDLYIKKHLITAFRVGNWLTLQATMHVMHIRRTLSQRCLNAASIGEPRTHGKGYNA